MEIIPTLLLRRQSRPLDMIRMFVVEVEEGQVFHCRLFILQRVETGQIFIIGNFERLKLLGR